MIAPAATARAASRRPPTAARQSRWLLRLHRPALCIWAGLVIMVSAALLWLSGPMTDAAAAAWQQYEACAMHPTCSYDQSAILRYKDVYQYVTIAVLSVPFLVASWAGATLTSRELETGTAYLMWAQSVSPTRWLAVRLSVPAALTVVGTTVLVTLHHFAWSAGEGRISTAKTWYDPATFYAGGPVTIALALTGLAVGALTGFVWRRSLPSLITSLVTTAGLFGIIHLALPHLWPSVNRVSSLTHDGSTGTGLTVDEGVLTSTGTRLPDPHCGSSHWEPCRATYDKLHVVSYYRDYHPLAHYWPLQLTATALLLTISASLIFVVFSVLKRRAGTASQ
ncbi:ABC transporter permease [Streptomyces olivaceus]|uniref:ABC transporter permease n=1 Tax=Streptomyces olivaceus TaxID=47716 RepID=UPI001CCFAA94|nr:ABC transporter permease [Streptomyces olivaceus]MBZ6226290.1 ABC transporter permease [Streptomyces olivaceus]